MVLTNKALSAITTKAKSRLALAHDCSIYTVDRWIKENNANGDLSKAISLTIISEETKIPVEELLEAGSEVEAQK